VSAPVVSLKPLVSRTKIRLSLGKFQPLRLLASRASVTPQNVRATSHLRRKRLSWAQTMICVSRGPAFGPCGWPNASGGERMAAAPALEHFCPAPRQDQAVQATCFRRSSAPSPSVLDSASNPLTGVRCSGSYRDRGAAKQLQIRGPHILLGEFIPSAAVSLEPRGR